ncbi:MAG: putative quinol monooxygenase [Actinomycetota bacterium]
MATGESYASGNWLVAAGNEEAFVSHWTEFLEWTRADHQGFQTASLIRDADDPRHFVSFARWDDAESRAAWKQSPGFAQRMGACRALCDQFSGSDYATAVQID